MIRDVIREAVAQHGWTGVLAAVALTPPAVAVLWFLTVVYLVGGQP